MDTTNELHLSFAEHLQELRKRFVRIAVVVGIGAVAAFIFSQPITQVLQRPLGDKLYYFTPGGGFSFTVQIAMLVGLIIGLPTIFYQLGKFVMPAFASVKRKHLATYYVLSILLAAAGVGFAYFLSLPPAIRILKSLSPQGVEALIGAQDYAKFVMIYLAGYALLFQLPLIVNFIDRIKPLKPKKLNGYQRHAFAGSFIAAGIITPTPDVLNQAIFALPMILLFEVSVGIIVFKHWQRTRGATVIMPAAVLPHEPPVYYPDNWDHEQAAVVTPVDSASEAREPEPTLVADYLPGFDIATQQLS